MIKDIDPPNIEPVSLQSAKAFLRVDHDGEDELITDLIKAARMRIESHLSISLITRRQYYEKSVSETAGLYINHYPIKRVIAVESIFAGETQHLHPSDYLVNLHARPATLRLLSRSSQQDQALRVELEAGFGATVEDVPMPIRQAIMLLIAQSFEHRGDDGLHAMPMMVDALLMPYRGLRL